MFRPTTATFLLCLAAALAPMTPAGAASVRLVGFDELVESSALVFHGRVLDTRSRWLPGHQGIVTDVEFDVIEVFKGEAPGRLSLSFAGGTVDGVGMRVHGLTRPVADEEGVYFVEQLDHPQVNPLYGWDQGHYRVRATADGVRRVFANSGAPVLTAAPAASPARVRLSPGVPLGVTVGPDGVADAALPLADFAASIRAAAAPAIGTSR
jgi:hypothetical protein